MKAIDRITYGQLESVLLELVFGKKVAAGAGMSYQHSATGALIVVRAHKSNEVVPDFVMVGARHELDWRGVVDLRTFEEMLQAAAA